MKLGNLAFVVFAAYGFLTSAASADTGLPLQTTEDSVQAVESDEPIFDTAETEFSEEGADVSTRAVSCTTQKYNTAGCIQCSGSGEVRIVIDCKAPQVTDYKGSYTRYSGSLRQCGECNFGINSVSYQAR